MAYEGKTSVTHSCGHVRMIEWGAAREESARDMPEFLQRHEGRRPCRECMDAARRYEPGKVAIEDGADLEAYICTTERWNGWALPAFTKEQLPEYFAWQNDMEGSAAHFDEARDAVITKFSDSDEEDVWTGEDIITTDGETVHAYPVGAGAWVWWNCAW